MIHPFAEIYFMVIGGLLAVGCAGHALAFLILKLADLIEAVKK